MNEALITIKNLKKVFPRTHGHRGVEVFSDIDLTIHKGEFLVLLGPSGCGKSTFLRILAGLDTATSGEVVYHDSISGHNMNFVFQNFGLLPWLSVFQNVAIGLLQKNITEHELIKETDSILEKLGLLSFKHSYPHEISGGMKQRVGLARAFATKPDIIFLDEPFSELDFSTAKNLREILLSMWKERGVTVIMVSHYIDEAVYLSDRIAIFSDRTSKIRKIITNTLSRERHYRSPEFFALEDEVLKYFE